MKTWPIIAALLLSPAAALAHKASDSYLTLWIAEDSVRGQWDIALRDLEYAIGLDADGDGAITWGELRARHDEVARYALAHLRLGTDGGPCAARAAQHLVDEHSDGAYAVLRFDVDCPAAPRRMTISYRLLFDLDPLHRGLLRLDYLGSTRTAVFGPDDAVREFELDAGSALREAAQYAREGVWHIWGGYDHLLFLICLLLPCVLRFDGRHWRAGVALAPVTWETVTIVTSFTVAHSVTLTLAVLEIVSLPSRLVESVIAASVILAALNNVWPLVRERIWIVTFVFGLVHGLGFASALLDLGLPTGSRLTALLGFNLGVEIGQLAIVALVLPPAWWLRETWLYRGALRVGGSLAVAGLAMAWLLERSLGLSIL